MPDLVATCFSSKMKADGCWIETPNKRAWMRLLHGAAVSVCARDGSSSTDDGVHLTAAAMAGGAVYGDCIQRSLYPRGCATVHTPSNFPAFSASVVT